MNYIEIIICFIIAAALLIFTTGCKWERTTELENTSELTAPAVVSVAGAHRYGYRAIEPPEGKVFRKRFAFGTVIGNSYLLGDRLYLECLPEGQPEAGEICYAEYDAEGVFVSLHEIALPEEIYDAVIDGEGRIVGVTETEVATLLRRYDPDTHAVECENTITGIRTSRIVLLEGEPYAVLVEQDTIDTCRLQLLDAQLCPVGEICAVSMNPQWITVDKDGALLLCDGLNTYRLGDSGTLTPVTTDRYGSFPALDGTVYTRQRDGIFDQYGAQTLDWNDSGLVSNDIEVHMAWDPAHLFVTGTGNLSGEAEYAVLYLLGEDVTRSVVTIQTCGAALPNVVQRAIAVFNRTNEQYYVEYVPDTRYDAVEAGVSGISFTDSEDFDRLTAQILDGSAPDIQLFAKKDDAFYRLCTTQGYFRDLSALRNDSGTPIVDALTDSARRTVQSGDIVDRLPLSVTYETVLAQTGTTLTIGDILAKARDLSAEEMLFPARKPALSLLTRQIAPLFVERKTGTHTLDDPAFLRYLELLYTIGQSMAESGALYGANYAGSADKTWYTLDDVRYIQWLREGRLQYLPFTLCTVDGWGAAKAVYPDAQLCGYPDAIAIVGEITSAAILRDAKNGEGAAAFLRFLLSDTVQTSALIRKYSFPVTHTAMESLLAVDHYRYSTQEMINDGITSLRIDIMEGFTGTDPAEAYGWDYPVVPYTDADRAILQNITENAAVTTPDPTLTGIIREEVDAYIGGARDAAETARVLKSRVEVYLGEKK